MSSRKHARILTNAGNCRDRNLTRIMHSMLKIHPITNLERRRSNGHGCMLQYALLHLFGYDLSLEDLKNFRVCNPKIIIANIFDANRGCDIASRL